MLIKDKTNNYYNNININLKRNDFYIFVIRIVNIIDGIFISYRIVRTTSTFDVH